MSVWPPAPEPKTTPTSVRFSSVSSKPESASACLAAATPKCMLGFAAPGGLGVHPVGGVEVVDLAAELGLVRRRVETGDRTEAGDAVDEVAPGGADIVPDRS